MTKEQIATRTAGKTQAGSAGKQPSRDSRPRQATEHRQAEGNNACPLAPSNEVQVKNLTNEVVRIPKMSRWAFQGYLSDRSASLCRVHRGGAVHRKDILSLEPGSIWTHSGSVHVLHTCTNKLWFTLDNTVQNYQKTETHSYEMSKKGVKGAVTRHMETPIENVWQGSLKIMQEVKVKDWAGGNVQYRIAQKRVLNIAADGPGNSQWKARRSRLAKGFYGNDGIPPTNEAEAFALVSETCKKHPP